MKKFTIEEFRNYLLSQDSRGDIMYNLSEENIVKANKKSVGDNEYGQFLCDELSDAITQFGEYTYHDKGADEILYISTYVKELNKKSIEEVAGILTYLLDNHEDANEMVSCLISSMDDRDDFEELFEYDDRFEY
jgi:hypothetical protein